MPFPSPFPQGGALEEETEAWGDDRSGGVVLLRGEYSLARVSGVTMWWQDVHAVRSSC